MDQVVKHQEGSTWHEHSVGEMTANPHAHAYTRRERMQLVMDEEPPLSTPSIWFVTPAFKRFEMTDVCLDQRLDVIAYLATIGIEGHCVVVADDDNLDIARAKGFDVVEQDNEWLGRKFNDGIQYAGEHGATWIVPIGSDSWIDPLFFLNMPVARWTRTSALYCVVEGDRLGELRVRGRVSQGAGPFCFHRSLFSQCGFRPAVDEISRGVDGSTIRGLGPRVKWADRRVHAFQYLGFRGSPRLSEYQLLYDHWGVEEYKNPWDLLKRFYPAGLVDRMRPIVQAS